MKTVVVLQPFGAGNLLAHACKNLGYRLIILASDQGLRNVPDDIRDMADIFRLLDTNDENQVSETLRDLENQGERIDAIVPGFETYVEMANQFAREMGLNCLPLDCAERVRYKDKMRLALQEAGLPNPGFAIVDREQDLMDAVRDIGFPAVLKATNLGGSFNVRMVFDRDEAVSVYREMMKLDVEVLDLRSSPRVMYEEYMAGPEFSIEAYINEGVFNLVSITEKRLGPEPYFVELGHIVEADLDNDVYHQIADYIARVVQCLDVTFGPIHAEARVTRDGVKLVEIAARLAGDNICDLVKIAKGVDMAEIMVKSYLGEPVSNYEKQNNRHAGIVFFHLDEGLPFYHETRGLEVMEQLPGFEKYSVLRGPGVELKPLIDCSSRVAWAIFSGPDYELVHSSIEKAKQCMQYI